MNELVMKKNQQVVTSSRKIAEVFNRRHDHVLDAIDNLIPENAGVKEMFGLTQYENERGRMYPEYLMNRDGFTLLAMGFTGQKALQFKLKYISAFNEMEKSLNAPKQLTEKEQLRASLRLTLETSEEVEVLKEDVEDLKEKVENQITLDHGEQRGLQRAIGRKVFEYAKSDDHKRLLYPELHREIKDRFGVTSYKDVKRKDLLSAVRYVNAWIPKKAA